MCLALLLASESDDPSTSSGVTDVLAICFVSLSVITETLEHFLGLGRMVCWKLEEVVKLDSEGLGEGIRKRLFLIATVLAS